MKGLLVTVAAVGAVATSYAAAVDITGKDPSEWPTSGDVSITNGTITVTDDEVDIVSGWDSVTMQPSATLKINNTSVPLVLKAKIQGNCWFRADNSCGLTLAGDNRGHGGNQFWKFVDSNIIVTHEYGLGPNSNDLRCEFTYTIGNTTGNLTFHNPEWDKEEWTGKKAFTNHSHILFIKAGSGKVTNDGKFLAIGSSAADEYFVQDGNFNFEYSGQNTYFRYNYEQISGKIGPSYDTTGYCMLGVASGMSGELRFSGTTKINGCHSENTTQNGTFLCYHNNVHFGHSGGTHGRWQRDQGNDYLEADNVFDDYVEGCDPAIFSPIAMNDGIYLNSMDMQGHSMRIRSFGNYYNNIPKETSTYYYYLKSTEPATVTLYRATKTGADTTDPTPTELRDNVSLVVDNGITNRISTRVSTTKGTLTVKSQSALVYQWKGGWAGSDVTVEDNATIDALSTKSFTAGSCALTLAPTAQFVMHNGSPVTFTFVTAGSVELPLGTWTRAQLVEKFGLGSIFTGDDAATITVVGATGEFAGWPTTEGATVDIPQNQTVTVAAADLENVAKAATIRLAKGSTLVFESIEDAISVPANIEGWGQLKIIDCTDAVIGGDNSKLLASASAYIEHSKVRVLKGTGLGSATTGRATLKFGDDLRRVYFGAADTADTITNEVPLKLVTDVSDANKNLAYHLGEGVAGKKLVLAGDIQINRVGPYLLVFRGEVEVLGDIDGLGWYSIRAIKFSGSTENNVQCHVTFGEDVDISVSGDKNNRYSVFHQGSGHDNGVNIPTFTYKCKNQQTQIGTLHFNVPDVEIKSSTIFGTVDTTVCGFYYYTDVGGKTCYYLNTLRLCGNNVAFNNLNSQHAAQHATALTYWADVASTSPAYVIYVNGQQNRRESLRFREQAGFWYQSTGTNILAGCASDTTGDLRVSSGMTGLDWGATWAGSATVEGTGTLFIGAESATAGAFGTVTGAKRSSTVLTVKDSGKVQLESGTTVVYNAYEGDEKIERGTYCAADNAEAIAEGATAKSWITGAGVLRVLRGNPRGIEIIFR